jgi:outer membrane protein insertion porin family
MRIFLLLLLTGVALLQNGRAQNAKVSDPAAAAKAHGDPNATYPLRAIEIQGNEKFPDEKIIALSGLEIGRQVREADFQEALNKINSAGVFDSLEYRYGAAGDGYRVTFTVVEVSELYPVRFAGFDVPDEEIQKLLQENVPLFGPKVPATGPVVERIGNTLQKFWDGLGKDTKVVGTLAPLGDDQFEMLFQPEGAIETIAFTKFENTSVIPALELQRVFQGRAVGVPYSQERIVELLRFNIGPLYEAKGYMEVKYCPCATEPDTGTRGLVVTVKVDEGVPYKFGAVAIPARDGRPEGRYEELLKFKSGELANMTLVADSQGAIEAVLKDQGFMNATVEEDRKIDRELKTVDVTLTVDEGDRYTFNRLTIEGLNVIGESAVRKRWGLKLGDAFNASYPAFFLSRIGEEGMFDNLKDTGWSMQVNEGDKTVDVKLTFQ